MIQESLLQLLELTKKSPIELSENQHENLLKNTIRLLRLRVHEGYFFDVYAALKNMTRVLEEKFPKTNYEYSIIIMKIINQESDVLPKILLISDVQIKEAPTEEEHEILAYLLKETPLQEGEKGKILTFFLENKYHHIDK